MIRQTLLAAMLLALPLVPAFAEDHDHETSVGAITVVHPWARAASAGAATMVYFEIENAGEAVQLSGAESDVAATVELVGATLASDGTASHQPVGSVQIAPGHFELEPAGLGFLLTGLMQDLVQGEHFELEVEFGNGDHLHLHVAIEAADATQHSHAGHSH